MDTDIANLEAVTRAHWRAVVQEALDQGRLEPLVIPHCIFGAYILPIVWLAIPHADRPWLYHCRWPIMAFIIGFDLNLIKHRTSTNPAFAYAVGLLAIWGIIANMNLLIWNSPQLEAARIVRQRKGAGPAPTANGFERSRLSDTVDGPRRRKPESSPKEPSAITAAEPSHASGTSLGYEHVWEPFPADAPFLTRLHWGSDLVLNFRFAGWNIAIPSLPRPRIPEGKVRVGEPVDLSVMPEVSSSGYKRSLTGAEFVRSRLLMFAAMYLLLDFLAVAMMKDPYFILGPDSDQLHRYALPPPLQALPDQLLLAWRELLSVAGVISAIVAVFCFNDIVQYYLGCYVYPSRGELWMHFSAFGSFFQVLDRGLAGWWGAWWHQTFRQQFAAPTAFLRRRGYIRRGTVIGAIVTMFVSFAQSGMLHAFGSLSAMPPTKPWRAPVFFLAQAVGILIQYAFSAVLERWMPALLPRPLCRAANLVFSLAWLHVTAPVFVDDLASTGLWLLEPVPVSPLRYLGFGHPDDHWLRWTREYYPTWHADTSWWRSGLAF